MKIFFVLSIFVSVASYCGAETFSVNASDPNYPGMCYYDSNVYPPGEFQIPFRCVRLICSPNGWVSGHGCIVSNLAGCFRGQQIDIKQIYPECCRRNYICTHGDGTEYGIVDY